MLTEAIGGRTPTRMKEKIALYLTIIKYLFSIIISFISLVTIRNIRFIATGLAELLLIAVFCDWLVWKKPIVAKVINCILLFFYNVQMILLLFAGSYLQLVMLSNLESIQDLQGKALEYVCGALAVVIFSTLPVRAIRLPQVRLKHGHAICFLCACLAEAVALIVSDVSYSPAYNYAALLQQEYEIIQLKNSINSIDASADEFYYAEVNDYREKDDALPENPNVILIFTEGLSQNIIDDERNIMPNLAMFEESSINFTNYYNHTFATYRGLSGQLYSGHQLNNLDENNLISIQDILKLHQYYTAFINVEPTNDDFTSYINSFGFDEVLGTTADELSGGADSYSDREAYELLFDTAIELEEARQPFFLTIYTFGTHVSFDSEDEVFGDGEDSALNKFYNLDYQFGLFLEVFNESTLADNTIIVFTTDHASYTDSDYLNAFPDYERVSTALDEIPLCIYYKGIVPETYDVNGRNSLDLAPTILDYLDISGANYFLGTSLFSENENSNRMDTIFYEEGTLLTTEGGIIKSLDYSEASEIKELLQRYFNVKLQDASEVTFDELDYLEDMANFETSLSDDGSYLTVSYTPGEETIYDKVTFAVWDAEDGQDDLVWYDGVLEENGLWYASVDLSQHSAKGYLYIHVYAEMDDISENVGQLTIMLGE